MRFKDLFPGVAFATPTLAARAAGFSAKTLRNKFYQGDNPLGIIKVDGRLIVPAENFDAWLDRAYRAGGLGHLAGAPGALPAPSPTHSEPAKKRGRGRPRKVLGGVK